MVNGVVTNQTIQHALTYLYEWGVAISFMSTPKKSYKSIMKSRTRHNSRTRDKIRGKKTIRDGHSTRSRRLGVYNEEEKRTWRMKQKGNPSILEERESKHTQWQLKKEYDNKYKNQLASGFSPSYPLHLMSQMTFYNLYPPESLYNQSKEHDHKVKNGLDIAIRVEKLSKGWSEAMDSFPNYLKDYPPVHQTKNHKHGRSQKEEDSARYSCQVAWEVYEYFKQDFICLGYELPIECMRKNAN